MNNITTTEQKWHWLLMVLTRITLTHDNYSPFPKIICCKKFPPCNTPREKSHSWQYTNLPNALPLKVFFPSHTQKHCNSSTWKSWFFKGIQAILSSSSHISLIPYKYYSLCPILLVFYSSIPFWDVSKYGSLWKVNGHNINNFSNLSFTLFGKLIFYLFLLV